MFPLIRDENGKAVVVASDEMILYLEDRCLIEPPSREKEEKKDSFGEEPSSS